MSSSVDPHHTSTKNWWSSLSTKEKVNFVCSILAISLMLFAGPIGLITNSNAAMFGMIGTGFVFACISLVLSSPQSEEVKTNT